MAGRQRLFTTSIRISVSLRENVIPDTWLYMYVCFCHLPDLLYIYFALELISGIYSPGRAENKHCDIGRFVFRFGRAHTMHVFRCEGADIVTMNWMWYCSSCRCPLYVLPGTF